MLQLYKFSFIKIIIPNQKISLSLYLQVANLEKQETNLSNVIILYTTYKKLAKYSTPSLEKITSDGNNFSPLFAIATQQIDQSVNCSGNL